MPTRLIAAGLALLPLVLALAPGLRPAIGQPGQPDVPRDGRAADPVTDEIAEIGRQLAEPDLARWYALEHRMLELRHRPELHDMLLEAIARDDAVASRRARQFLALLSRPIDPQLDAGLPQLAPNLFSSDVQRRLKACDLLWRHRTPAAAAALIELLRDEREDRELRLHAVLALAVQAVSTELLDAIDTAISLPDPQLAIAGVDVLDALDRRAAAELAPGADSPPPAARAVRIARIWMHAAEIWRREHAWRILARHPHELDGADLLDRLFRFREDEPAVRAVMWRALLQCDDALPADPVARLEMLRRAARLIPREYWPASSALKAFIHQAGSPALLARLVTDGELDDNVIAALPASAREAAAWHQPARFERFVQHPVTAMARNARASIVQVGGGAALMTRLPSGKRVLGQPRENLRALLRRVSRETGLDVVIAPSWPLLDSLPLPGVFRGGSVYDVLAVIGELYGLRFAFEGQRLVLHSAGHSASGQWWPPRRSVPSGLLDRFNLRLHDAAGQCETGEDGRPTLEQLMVHCGSVLDAPVVCSPGLAERIGLGIRLDPLPAARPLATALPQSLEPHGLKATFRGASLWIGSGDELAAWAAVERFRTRPEPAELARLAQNALLDSRPVVAECLSLESPPADVDAQAAWVDTALAELVREFARADGHRDARVAFMLRVLGPYVTDARALDWLVNSLGVSDGLTRAAAHDTLVLVSPELLWNNVAPRLPGLPPTAQRELADVLCRSVTPVRFGALLDALARNPALAAADDRVLRLRALRGPLSRVAAGLLPSESVVELPVSAPVRWEIGNASPAFFFYALEICTGRRITPGPLVRDWWTRLEPLQEAELGGASVYADWRFELPRALRDVGLGVGGHTPLPLEARWYPGVSASELERGAAKLPAELMVEAPGARSELALFERLVQHVAQLSRTDAAVAPGRRALANFAFWLTAFPGVQSPLANAARTPLPEPGGRRLRELGPDPLPDERVPAADRVIWQRVQTWLRLLESGDAPGGDDDADEAIARLGIRIRHMAGQPLTPWYGPWRERDSADPAWTDPRPPMMDDENSDR